MTSTRARVGQSAAQRIDALLPQTQCTRCGYPSCREYAEALAMGLVDLNRCPPGGTATIGALARVLNRETRPLDPACGEQRPWVVARIEEASCIGCTLCIHACPVDAILGAAKRMHTVIESECTGCELCLAPCPVDCIRLVPMKLAPTPRQGAGERGADTQESFLNRWMRERADLARRRFVARRERLARLRRARTARRVSRRDSMPGRDADRATKRDIIRAAVERVRERRGARDC
jgi:Na+-translocating ferredoxin:NAD+ oxidoreductase subunit B